MSALPRSIPGHPPALTTLFLTEFWERFSYYGMRALLILFLTADPAIGGLGWGAAPAAAVYGLYTASVYLAALPGGWLVDRLLGQRASVLIGGIVIAAGHFTMAVAGEAGFFLGLVLIVIGTGLLKPAVTAMVGALYPEGGARRDAGFSIFYMGINLGGAVAPLVTGYLGQRINWHLGFGVAGIGMVLGVLQYLWGARHLGQVGLTRPAPEDRPRWLAIVAGVVGVIVLGFVGWRIAGSLPALARAGSLVIVLMVIGFFGRTLVGGQLSRESKRQVLAIAVFFGFSAICWSALEQAGSSLNLFAQRNTDLDVFGWAMPASWLQSVSPGLIIGLAPVFAWLWVALARRGKEPGTPAKFVAALALIGLGFVVMATAAGRTVGGALVSPAWLVVAYFLLTVGELSFSPVGYSLVTALSPAAMKGRMIGIWLTSLSLGNLLAGQISTLVDSLPLARLFGSIAIGAGIAALLMAAIARPLRSLMGPVR